MLFRQLYDATSSTYTYLLADEHTREAVYIDTVYEQIQRDLALLDELDLTLKYVLDTHCHADHVTGAWLMKQKTGCQIISAEAIGARSVDWAVKEGDVIPFGRHTLTVMATPGHTDGCVTYVTEGKTMAFTGDTVLIRGCGRSDFQQGNAATLYHSITDKIFNLPDDCAIYPAHDYNGRTRSSVGEEKQFNARAGGGASENDFVGYMNAMRLPHPKKLDIALPANLRSGEPEDGEIPKAPDWADIRITFSGVPEVDPEWVHQHQPEVTLLDVREANEVLEGEQRIEPSLLIPLSELRDRVSEVPQEKPVVCLCRSGRRSSLAVSILKEAGYDKVANIRGGLLLWKERGLA
ncbi:MAG: MBL fold metallo-hydrolase [Saccharospirillum sp.]